MKKTQSSCEGTHDKRAGTRQLVPVPRVEWVEVEVHGPVLDGGDAVDDALHLLVAFPCLSHYYFNA